MNTTLLEIGTSTLTLGQLLSVAAFTVLGIFIIVWTGKFVRTRMTSKGINADVIQMVSRAYLNKCSESERCEYLASYTTLATPWRGAKSAQSGIDMAPAGSDVLEDKYRAKDEAAAPSTDHISLAD